MSGMTLEQLAAVAEIVGAITIVSGLFFGWIQIRAYRVQQRDRIVITLMQAFHHPAFARAVHILHGLPDGSSAEELRNRGPEYEEAAVIICFNYETMGLLVSQKSAKLDLVVELTGGMVVSMYRKLELWMRTVREEQKHPRWGEWFEWLALQAQEKNRDKKPAHMT